MRAAASFSPVASSRSAQGRSVSAAVIEAPLVDRDVGAAHGRRGGPARPEGLEPAVGGLGLLDPPLRELGEGEADESHLEAGVHLEDLPELVHRPLEVARVQGVEREVVPLGHVPRRQRNRPPPPRQRPGHVTAIEVGQREVRRPCGVGGKGLEELLQLLDGFRGLARQQEVRPPRPVLLALAHPAEPAHGLAEPALGLLPPAAVRGHRGETGVGPPEVRVQLDGAEIVRLRFVPPSRRPAAPARARTRGLPPASWS